MLLRNLLKPFTPTTNKTHYRPSLEALEDRCVPTGTISGSVFIDATGNGSSPANAPQSNVLVHLYQDTNHNGVLDSQDKQAVPAQRTNANGFYSFTNLAPGNYFVTESVPSGFVRTVPTAQSYYAVTVPASTTTTTTTVGEFDNFQKLANVVTNVSFTIIRGSTTFTVTNLRGNTQQGDTVIANFSVPAGVTTTVALVSYDAPGATFNAGDASQQVPVEIASGTFTGPGTFSLQVQLPQNFYQVDFVTGSVITTFGPAGSNLFYSAQGRLLSADNEGTVAFESSSLSGAVLQNNGSAAPTGLADVLVTLSGTNDLGQQVTVTTTTDTNGNYSFTGLRQGTYTIAETPLDTFYLNAPSSLGAGDSGTAGTGAITGIVVTNGSNGTNYDLVQVLAPVPANPVSNPVTNPVNPPVPIS